MLELGKRHNVPVAALVGAKEHAVAQVQAGVDILVVAGGEAGGHCGDVSTMVLIPEVHRAVKQMGASTPILAAGGITTGGQMAAAMAMGAAGAWTGSVWLTTTEAETNPIVKQKDDRSIIARHHPLALAHRKARAPAPLAMEHDAWERGPRTRPSPYPITARPRGAFCSPPSPSPSAIGAMPMIMASASSAPGGNRTKPASSAAATGSPSSCRRSRRR